LNEPGGGFMNDRVTGFRNHTWAQRSFNLRYADCDRPHNDHFKKGFVSGYQAICDGGDGYIPALPPEEYWGYQYQCAEGAQCVNAWFKGYPAGVAAAKQDGAGAFHDMYTSKMIQSAVEQDKAVKKVPSEIPVVKTAAHVANHDTGYTDGQTYQGYDANMPMPMAARMSMPMAAPMPMPMAPTQFNPSAGWYGQ
jgi:hypothetical protein